MAVKYQKLHSDLSGQFSMMHVCCLPLAAVCLCLATRRLCTSISDRAALPINTHVELK